MLPETADVASVVDKEEDDDELLDLCSSRPARDPRGVSGDELCVQRVDARGWASLSPSEVGQRFLHFVERSQPVILTGCVQHWPAITRWSHDYLRDTLGSRPVHVARTPDGLADAVTRTHLSGAAHFAKAHEAPMPFCEFVDAIESPLHANEGCNGAARRAVHYCSHQNSSLEAEFEPIWGDVERSLPWADEAFGRSPAACNFWMGEDAARTTVHADLFDNLYIVVSGVKHFSLLPPQDGPALGRRPYRAGTYVARGADADSVRAGHGLTLELDEPAAHVHWTSLDLEAAEAAPLRPIRASVAAGEVLFLPALWWHAVSQSAGGSDSGPTRGGSTVAVNYWYEGPAALGDEAEAAAERAAERLAEMFRRCEASGAER